MSKIHYAIKINYLRRMEEEKETKKKKKLSKGKKKFFIIAACYVAIFVITSVVTASTLAWFNSETWQSGILYMGGPVYIHFSNNAGDTTSGRDELTVTTPDGWTKLYPGMNISFESRAVIEGKEFEKPLYNGDTVTYTTTGAVLRAKIKLTVQDTTGSSTSLVSTEIYNAIWPQLKNNALLDSESDGIWIFDQLNTNEEENYFYYCTKGQTPTTTGEYLLQEVGGKSYDVSVGFLSNSVVQLPPIDLTNEHADCTLTFTIVFEAVQAYFSTYNEDDLPAGDPRIGQEKEINIGNSRKIFSESQYTPENGYPYA